MRRPAAHELRRTHVFLLTGALNLTSKVYVCPCTAMPGKPHLAWFCCSDKAEHQSRWTARTERIQADVS